MNFPRTIDVAILGAVSREVDALVKCMQSSRIVRWTDGVLHFGTVAEKTVLVGTTGIGKVNAAISTTVLLESHSVLQVWNIGCAGAYAEGPLRVGDVLITKELLCGDEGVLTRTGVLPMSEIGIPILAREGEQFYDRIPADGHPATLELREKTPTGWYEPAKGPLPAPASPCCEPPRPVQLEGRETGKTSRLFRVMHGPSLTVGMASGDAETAGRRFQQYEAFAENMEGSAVAQACFRFGIPMLECRGISNEAGNRCKSHWQLEKAVTHCHGIILKWLQT